MLALAEIYGFMLKICQPYRAKTKEQVGRLNRYLNEGFVVPLRPRSSGRSGGWMLTLPMDGSAEDSQKSPTRACTPRRASDRPRGWHSSRQQRYCRCQRQRRCQGMLPRRCAACRRARAFSIRWRCMTPYWRSPHESLARTNCRLTQPAQARPDLERLGSARTAHAND